MTETAFYILLSLTKPRHGYGIVKHVEEISASRIRLGSGTVYGTLTKMQKDGIITVFADEERKTVYEITDVGKKLMVAMAPCGNPWSMLWHPYAFLHEGFYGVSHRI